MFQFFSVCTNKKVLKMPSFLQAVIGVCICYLVVRSFLTPEPKMVRYNLPDVLTSNTVKSVSLDTDDDENEEFDIDCQHTFSRQAGLDALEALIDKRPVATSREDVLEFLVAFKANKARWGVTPEDLRAMYLRKYNFFFLGKMFAKTVIWVPDYASYLQG